MQTAESPVVNSPQLLSPKPVRVAKPTLTPALALSPRGSPRATTRTLPPPPSPDPHKPSPRPEPKSQAQARAPPLPKPRRSQSVVATRPQSEGPTRRLDTPPSLPRRRAAPPSPAPPGHGAGGGFSNSLQLDSLTSAIMAGSLASSRHSTGGSAAPVGLPRRQRSPRLLSTLRPASGAHDDEAQRPQPRGHGHKLQRGKHAHHEGSRKRWRDALTARERKRYEAVWASNRGLLLGPAAHERVANVVVRDVWRRSRLPDDELAEVWELVDRARQGALSRHEFVVGMWLIDQRLRGRKLPPRVSDSVWGSVNGATVRRPRGG